MQETRISVPELMLVAATRAAAGAGLGLLVADWLSNDQRRAVGWTLVLVGVLSTIPLALEVFGEDRLSVARTESGGDRSSRARRQQQAADARTLEPLVS